jgi:hypothetical protein
VVCSDPFEEVVNVMPKNEVIKKCEEDFIDGIVEGLKDFAKGNYVVFEDDDELEAYMMSL